MLYLAVEGFTGARGGHYPGTRTDVDVWEAKRLIDEAVCNGSFEFFTPQSQQDLEAAEELLRLLRKWYRFEFPRHEPGETPELGNGDKVIVVQVVVDKKWFAAAEKLMRAGRKPMEAPGVKKRPHVVMVRGSTSVRVDVRFTFSLVTV